MKFLKAVDDATAAPACAEQQQQQLGAGVTGATVVADLKLFDLVLDSLFPSELIGAVVKWYYASFDEDYRLGYVRSEFCIVFVHRANIQLRSG